MNRSLLPRNSFFRLLLLAVCLLAASQASAQILEERGEKLNTDSLHQEFERLPWFGLYKDNYFVFGSPIGSKADKTNTNVKFQISVFQRLTKTVLPFNSYIYLFYSQRCIWNVLEKSLPMKDLNFNPGIGVGKPIIRKNGRFIGVVQLVVEHESNGRDSIWSRSWNKVSLGGNVMLTPTVNLNARVWIPIVDGEYNRDLLRYNGVCQMGVSYISRNKRFGASLLATKRKTPRLDFNTVVEVNYKFFKSSNQYCFLQYYNGYGENLLYYNQFRSQLRIGLVIKPKLFSEY